MPQFRTFAMNIFLATYLFIFTFWGNILSAGCKDSECARKMANADSTWSELLPNNTVLDQDMVDENDVYINYPFLYCKIVDDSIFKIRIPNLVRSNARMEIFFCWKCIEASYDASSLGPQGMGSKTFTLSIPRGKTGSYSIIAHPCSKVMGTNFRWVTNFQVNNYRRY